MGLIKHLPALTLIALTSGCLYVAPIEEEPEPEDTMPYISDTEPSLGLVTIDLDSSNNTKTFKLTKYGDDNLDQSLYSRIVIDYRPAGVDRIEATKAIEWQAGKRDELMYLLRPCEMASVVSGVFEDQRTIDLYFVLSDRPFQNTTLTYATTDFLLPFKVGDDHTSVYVQWTVRFTNACRKTKKE